ncbi:MAG TPA: serine hydrolase [Steroidobacteraceae bacterium]|nr:serine hydrolase [Steroidobacteraceae bacterium]
MSMILMARSVRAGHGPASHADQPSECGLRSVFRVAALAAMLWSVAAQCASSDTPVTQVAPAAVGIDAAPLERLDHRIKNGQLPLVDSLLVMRCDKIVFDRSYAHDYGRLYAKEAHTKGPLNARLTGPYNYFDPTLHPYYHDLRVHSLQSISKTVTSVLLGIAIARGDFKAPLSTPVLHYFDERAVKNLDDRKRRMTLENLLTMTSGLDWNEDVAYDDPSNPSDLMEASDDWIQFVIDRPMIANPGTVFEYSSGDAELLAYIFQKETHIDIEEYANAYLFQPLGIHAWHWKRSPLGVVDTEGGLYLRTEDLTKIGQLYLHEGNWHGKRIVSADWVRASISPHIDAREGFKYGYLWWLLPYGKSELAWVARGFGGQRLMVFPDEHLIVTSTAWHILKDASLEFDVLKELLPGVHPVACSSVP